MTTLKIGDKAPKFKTVNQLGETVESKDLIGKSSSLFLSKRRYTRLHSRGM